MPQQNKIYGICMLTPEYLQQIRYMKLVLACFFPRFEIPNETM